MPQTRHSPVKQICDRDRMWLLSTIKYVPRPTLMGFVPFFMMLACYLAFWDLPVELFGQPVLPLNLAVSVFLSTVLLRNILRMSVNKYEFHEYVGLFAGVFVMLTFAWLVLRNENPGIVQKVWGAYYLAHAAFVLITLRFFPKNIPNLTSTWASDHKHSPRALEFVALKYVLFALTGLALLQWSTELVWVIFATVGLLILNFATSWVIVMMLISERSDEN